MGQNENVIVQQLQDIKSNLEGRDIAKVYQLCDELKVTIDRYRVDESITSRIKIIARLKGSHRLLSNWHIPLSHHAK